MTSRVEIEDTIPDYLKERHPGLNSYCILAVYRGSVASGTAVEGSDKDLAAIYVPSTEYYFGLHSLDRNDGIKEIKHPIGAEKPEWDIVLYEVRKALFLLASGNPNILPLIFTPPSLFLKLTDEGRLILRNKDMFFGKHVFKSFAGFAKGQIEQMTKADKNSPNLGEKRKQLIEQFGFDTKQAAHAILALRQAIEFFTTYSMNVVRDDAQELLDIRNGLWTLEKVKEESEALFAKARDAVENGLMMADGPQWQAIDNVCQLIIAKRLGVTANDTSKLR